MEREGRGGEGEEMAQTMHAHMNKREKKEIRVLSQGGSNEEFKK
jgi:DNA-binding CsgD family transcriptional regulator